jgi:hypothetical protein
MGERLQLSSRAIACDGSQALFEVENPKNCAQQLSKPQDIYYSASADELYVVNPFRYEIQVYRSRKLYKTLIHDAPYGGIVGGTGCSPGQNMVYTPGHKAALSAFKSGEAVLVFRWDTSEEPKYCVDVFKGYE